MRGFHGYPSTGTPENVTRELLLGDWFRCNSPSPGGGGQPKNNPFLPAAPVGGAVLFHSKESGSGAVQAS